MRNGGNNICANLTLVAFHLPIYTDYTFSYVTWLVFMLNVNVLFFSVLLRAHNLLV